MAKLYFKKLLQNSQWLDDVEVVVDNEGSIEAINTGVKNSDAAGFAIPGFQNAHSHAFQYAMAGLAERHEQNSNDDFWAWRETMYKIALSMSPEDLENVASMLYSEMLRHGYTHVAEFHYLHHDKDGKPYSNLAEHGERLIAAAETAGINITLIPMFYQKGGFNQQPQNQQRRFISSNCEDYFKLLEASKRACKNYEGAYLAWGIHSLRAVEPDTIKQALNLANRALPFHIHISEQKKEVLDAQEYLKKRPLEWLLDNTEIDDRFHLVHATHINVSEAQGIADAKAQVVLCPSTEGNLGDGIFPLRTFQSMGGKWSIGTDSHISLNPLEELRLLDYGQRLTTHARNTFIGKDQPDSGLFGFTHALLSGRKAMGNASRTFFKVGEPFDAAVYDHNFPLFATSADKHLLSTIIYSGDTSNLLGTIVNGKWKVINQKHFKIEEIQKRFIKTIKTLNIR